MILQLVPRSSWKQLWNALEGKGWWKVWDIIPKTDALKPMMMLLLYYWVNGLVPGPCAGEGEIPDHHAA